MFIVGYDAMFFVCAYHVSEVVTFIFCPDGYDSMFLWNITSPM
jgi:hypothetical protein